MAVTNPDVFIPATNFAGAYGMTTMFGILPPVMALSMRRQLAQADEARAATRGAAATGDADADADAEANADFNADAVAVGGGVGGWSASHLLSRFELDWMRSPAPRMIPPGVPGGTPALVALSFSALAITLGQLRNDLQLHGGVVLGGGGAGEGAASATVGGATVGSGDGGVMTLASVAPHDAIAASARLAAAVGADAWDAAARLFP